MRNYPLIALFFLFIGKVYAQGEYHFELVTANDGLPHNEVTQIASDRAGFLWIATTEGLSRYDGTSFVTYKRNLRDSTTLLSNMIGSLAVDRRGMIWCGTHEGLSAFDPVSG